VPSEDGAGLLGLEEHVAARDEAAQAVGIGGQIGDDAAPGRVAVLPPQAAVGAGDIVDEWLVGALRGRAARSTRITSAPWS